MPVTKKITGIFYVVDRVGVEPTRLTLRGSCSTN